MNLRKIGATSACIALSATLLGIAGCAQGENAETGSEQEASSLGLPKVRVDGDGDLIQLTPGDDPEDAPYFQQQDYENMNVAFFNADERGCKSCHGDLKQTLKDMDYFHNALTGGTETEWTVQTCMGCHAENSRGYFKSEYTFATMMHGIHMDSATCMNCHDTGTSSMTESAANAELGGMELWDDVKHDKLTGITDVDAEQMDGSFSWNQDVNTFDQDDMFILEAQYYDNDYMRKENTDNGVPLDEEMFENWTLTVSGEVENPMTFTLGELVEEAPSETAVMKWSCVMNPVGGDAVNNVEVTGIPLSYIEEKVGVKDSATWVWPTGSDGFMNFAPQELSRVRETTCLLVYEINGERLSWNNGYPLVVVWGGIGCGPYIKEISNLEYGSDESVGLYDAWGFPNRDNTDFYNNPNVGIFDLKEGQVFKTGDTVVVSGYADAFNQEVVAVELSMDRGKTWKRFDIEGSDVEKLVQWSYEFTLEEDGFYCIDARAVRDDGKVTEVSVEKMFSANSDPDSLCSTAVSPENE